MKHRPVIAWLIAMELLVVLMVAVGGTTRLTDSGLSMVEWKFTGSLPPRGEEAWTAEFAKYQDKPEFKLLRPDMDVAEFKRIYFWEFLHRTLGRVIGLAFLLPLLAFLAAKRLDRRNGLRCGMAFALIVLQGLLGWYMVQSGLVHNPHVSHFRLASHLLLAFGLFCWILWIVLDLRRPREGSAWHLGWGLTALIVLQITWGAFVAGLEAGGMYNTWPGMQGRFIPPGFAQLEPFLNNLINNPGAIQWVHRWLGLLVVAAVTTLWWRWRRDVPAAHALLVLVLFQFLLGVATLVLAVPLVLGVLHQLTALALLAASVAVNHQRSRERRAA